MCGLCGFVQRGNAPAPATIRGMTSALDHRGPDDSGQWESRTTIGTEEWHVSLGHTRLAILDLSEHGHQPMHSPDGRATIVYNGEIYNFRYLREELRELGYTFHSDCDTEVLLNAYLAWGLGALPKINGMFAFALWDATDQRLVLARDRIGIKPLHYHLSGQMILFGSELRSLRRHPGFSARIHRGALRTYLRYGWLAGEQTIYENTYRLPPGHALIWQGAEVRTEAYWRMTDHPAGGARGSFEEAVDTLDQLLGDAVEDRLVSDVPLGAFLSGGIDSSVVVSLMKERARTPVRTFSIGFEDAGYDEAPHAKRIARHLGTDHTELYVDRSMARQVLDELPELFDEPLADPSAVPTVLLSRLTRREVVVALSGDGGDELFGGYDRFRKLLQLAPLLHLPSAVRSSLARASALLPMGSLRNGLQRLSRARDGAELAESFHADFDDDLLDRAVEPCDSSAANPYREVFLKAPGGSALRRAMYAEANTYLPDDVLTKVDRASMSVSLEVRVPILDYRVVEFAFSLPQEFLFRKRQHKAPLRAVLQRRVPDRLSDRPKHGFSFPIRALLGADLEGWTRKYLDSRRIAAEGLLDPRGVRQMVEQTRQRGSTAESRIWRLICFQRWLEHTHAGGAPGN